MSLCSQFSTHTWNILYTAKTGNQYMCKYIILLKSEGEEAFSPGNLKKTMWFLQDNEVF